MAKKSKRPSWFKLCLHHKSLFDALPDAVAGRAIKAALHYFATGETLQLAELKAMSLDNEHRAAIIKGFKTAQILYIDDLYKMADGSRPTPADVGLAFEIINYRYTKHLTTIVSTERTPQELVEIDEATGSRIIEVAGDNVYSIGRDQKRNYRLRGVVNV